MYIVIERMRIKMRLVDRNGMKRRILRRGTLLYRLVICRFKRMLRSVEKREKELVVNPQ